ncbi:MAG: hypothetical protein ACFB4I_02440 [Cyanophyceae cyanobacterium]
MAIIALKAWYLKQYEPIREVVKRPHDLRLSRSSLLKTGMRADFLDDTQAIQESRWFERYLDGDAVEFYIEGSGSYAISNIDLVSHEIYFTKQVMLASLEPIIFFSYQTEYGAATDALRSVLKDTLETLNKKSRLSLKLEEAQRPLDTPLRLSDTQLRKIRKCLLLIADSTPIACLQDHDLLMPSPHVCVEIGYALQSKRPGQILLTSMKRSDLTGQFPLDLPNHQQLQFKSASELKKTLPTLMEASLERFNLFS